MTILKDIEAEEKCIAKESPLWLVEEGFLTIKTKAGEMVKFKLNVIQRMVLDKIKSIMDRGKPVRLWILKARQTGISTLIEAIVYAYTSQGEATNSLVVADDIDGANYIFSMQKLFHEILEPHLKPEIKHSNEKKLEFDRTHSQILIETSENLRAGRKYTFRFVHLSEVAFFKDLKALMLGLNQAVPNLKGTMMIGETTANGLGNQFYDEWVNASNGMSDWETLFIPWFLVSEYSMNLANGMYPIDAIEFASPTEKEKFLIEEQQIKKKYSLSLEQISWRRWCIVNQCNRKVLEFNQEYPDSAETAFISTGDLFFDKTALKAQEIVKPQAIGNIVKEESKYVFRLSTTGLFKIYEYPVKGGQYVVAGDPAEGLENQDKSSAIVLNKRTNRTVATYNHNIPPDRFAEDLAKLAYYYNTAIVACENKGYGHAVNQDLYRNYGRVYRKIRNKKGFNEPTMDLGWNTNSATRPQMLSQMAEEIANGSTELLDKDLIMQCWTFINNTKKMRAEAEKGKNDDLVMSRAICGQVRLEQPYKDKEFKKKKRKPRLYGGSGY